MDRKDILDILTDNGYSLYQAECIYRERDFSDVNDADDVLYIADEWLEDEKIYERSRGIV